MTPIDPLFSKGPKDIPPLTTTTKQYLGRYCGQMEDICYIMCPGTALNHHNTEFNTSMKKVSDTELHIYALKDIHKGNEILYNYNNNGSPPKWFGEFVKSHEIPIPFKGYNDFMDK